MTTPARHLVVLAATAAVVLACAAAATAGGFAAATLDTLPAAPRAGEEVAVGYTVRGHGITPMPLDGTAVEVAGPDGATVRFPGRPEGPVGHYVARVRVPWEGEWSWSLTAGAATFQDLGTLRVAAPAPAAAAPAPDDDGGPGALALGLLAGAVAAALAAGARLLTAGRRPAT